MRADYATVHLNEAVRLPASLDWRQGALVEPLAVGLHAVRRARHVAGKNVLVIGAGPPLVWPWACGPGFREPVTSLLVNSIRVAVRWR